jgi:hypothetical protein
MLNFKFRLLGFSLLILSILFTSSCGREATITPTVSSSVSNPSPTPSPINYDIICFQRHDFSTMGVKCNPDQIFKIPRGTEVTTYLETKTSVQSGKYITISFTATKQTEKISISEMESLSSKDSQVYVMNSDSKVSVGSAFFRQGEAYSAKVSIFDRNSGKFKLFGEGAIQKLGEDNSKFIFTAGDTDILILETGSPSK